MTYPILDGIRSPSDLKSLSEEKIPQLAAEIRSFLVEHVTRTGGHLASNLGVVELTLALHRSFSLPTDRILFDVGHQSYVHKLLSDRKDAFPTLRSGDGLSGFTKRCESPYDPFGAGHSSTSLSAALGFAAADAIQGSDCYTIAVIGDGAFTGGMIHEALNNCPKQSHLILILNENEMSISRNIGRYARHLAKLRTSRGYLRTKSATRSILRHMPHVFRVVRGMKQRFKNMLYHSNFFEELGIFYLGPADGNDYGAVHRLLEQAKRAGQTTVIHLKTQKGKGYPPAEKDPNVFHTVPPQGVPCHTDTFSHRFGELLTARAAEDPSLCAITAAMCDGTGLLPFRAQYPKRFFDVGIAEEHALTFAAGLAAAGMKPIFAVYSTFLQRGYDQLLHDIALQNLPVTLAIDRAGLNLRDGATHHGIFDVAMLMGLPPFHLYAPVLQDQLAAALDTSLAGTAPSAFRYPNASVSPVLEAAFSRCAGGDPLAPRENGAATADCVILTYGAVAEEALRAQDALLARGISCKTVLLCRLAPLAEAVDSLIPLLEQGKHILFLEEGVRAGGAGMCIEDALLRAGILHGKSYDLLAIEQPFTDRFPGGNKYRTVGISASDAVRVLCERMGIDPAFSDS